MNACRRSRCFLIAVMLAAAGSVTGAPQINHPARFKVNSVHLDSGPSRDWVNSIRRDATGYLWVGTDNGLRRYNGYEYTVFSHDSHNPASIGSNSIYTLLIDSEQTLWVGSRVLSSFNAGTETFENYPIPGDNLIWGMAEGPDGIIWVAGESFGLMGLDKRKRQVIYHSSGNPGTRPEQVPDTISHLINDSRDPSVLWMTATTGLFRFDTKTLEFRRLFSPEELGHIQLNPSSMLAMDRDGTIWVASGTGLYAINPETRSFRHYRHQKGNPRSLSTDILTSVLIDSKHRIWVGTDKQGAHIYEPTTDDFIHVPASATEPAALRPAAVNEIYEDDHGSLWFSMGPLGVQRISEQLEKFIAIGSGTGERQLSWDMMMDLLEDRAGNIWIATDGGGLDRYDPKTGKIAKYFHDPENPRSLSSDSVISLEQDRRGRIWAGTWAGGLNRLDPGTGDVVRYQHDPTLPRNRTLANNNIFAIVEDDDGWLWLSVWIFGIQRLNPETGEFQSFQVNGPSGLTNSSINAIVKSRRGWRWIGGYQGLEKYDPVTRHFTRIPLGEKTYEVYALHEDASGILWVATVEGLFRYDAKTGDIRHYTVDDGLADPFIASIEQDKRGHLWLGTRNGLSSFDPATETFETFDKFDGLPANEFHRFSHLYASDGIMYFGGPNGLVLFDPENLPRNMRVPQIVLTGLELFQKPVLPGSSPFLPRQLNLLGKLMLPYEQRDITFEFAALDFISPSKNRYRYRLEGLEDGWTEVDSSRRRVRYTNLDPGRYQFHVIGSNNDGLWNEDGTKLDLVIIPPWWMTWWARLLGVALCLCAVYGFTMWRLRVIRQREKALSIEIEERRVAQKALSLEVEERRAAEKALSLEVEERRAAERALSTEIEERRAAEAKLFHIAYHDALTGLPNRLWLLERLDEQIALARSNPDHRFALMFIDGDRFKQINDTHGHQLGDFVLIAAAKRLQSLSPQKYKVSRLGGDEFTVLVEGAGSEDEIVEACDRIIAAFSEPFEVEQNLLFFKVSIGLVFCGSQYSYPGQILRDADIAMYKAKEHGRGTYQLFDSKMHEQTLEVSRLEADLYKAFEQNQLFPVYQPIVDLKTGHLTGFEALARWRHPEKGLIPPDKFIPIAEESGLIFTLGAWVLRQACTQLAAWIKEYRLEKPPTLAVNLSSLELNQPYFLAEIDQILKETGIDSRLLKLELTESTLMENSESMNLLLDELRLRQIELAIDDFGTGYSSLSYLDQLPVQVLKIDRKFVNGITQPGEGSSSSVEIVRATISLAHSLNIMVVAEGIETEQQYQLLKSYGCDFGQGYYIARPLSSEDAARFMGHEPNTGTTVRVAVNSDIFGETGRFPRIPGTRRRYRSK
ncbi:MAG TPA: EAL domain-containing protein [Gammaproteobacteria bacterium]|nr:EAL domain-containing protein [Gammaproteobacteria bacterium]